MLAVVGECVRLQAAGYRRLMCVFWVLQRGIPCGEGCGGRAGDLVVLVCYMVNTKYNFFVKLPARARAFREPCRI
jgi:hypothetical protein